MKSLVERTVKEIAAPAVEVQDRLFHDESIRKDLIRAANLRSHEETQRQEYLRCALIDATPTHQSKLLQKLNVSDGSQEDSEAMLYCVAQHIKAYHDQCCDEELADWGRPCSQCDRFSQCDVNDGVNRVSEFCNKQGVGLQFSRKPVCKLDSHRP